jgi:hypothetical protein
MGQKFRPPVLYPTFAAMLRKTERIEILSQLGEILRNRPVPEDILEKARQENPFFIPRFSLQAIDAISAWHQKPVLEHWLQSVPEETNPKKTGVVLAGNIPLVGWHDLLSVFAAGHIAFYKPSSQDTVLTDWLIGLLTGLSPESGPYFQKTENLKNAEALIATGSSNTASHFDYYFRHLPRIIRGSKSSLGVVYGFENEEELQPLCDDIMQYFGLGCRNVSKLLVPAGYSFETFFRALEKYRFVTDHHKFQNNAIYHKSIFLMNGTPFLDHDILMVRKEASLFSPLSVLNFEEYDSLEHAASLITGHQADLQCLVSFQGKWEKSISFGTSQLPGMGDYADGVDTLDFLNRL